MINSKNLVNQQLANLLLQSYHHTQRFLRLKGGRCLLELNLDGYTFGVEIEFTGISRKEAADAVAAVLESVARYVGGGYREYRVTDSKNREWKIMSDSSILAQRKLGGRIVEAGEDYKCEFVTPILRYTDDIDTLQNIVRALRKAKAHVNNSCGVHVHVGAEKHNPKTLRNLANIFHSKQDMLYKALNVLEGRERYCKKMDEDLVDRINKHKPETVTDFGNEVYQGYGGLEYNQRQHYSSARYFGINFHAYYTKKTIEFRLYNSILHAGWIRTYVILSIAINNQAIMQRSASSKVTTSTNECFTFRTWLLRMGFIGEVTETPRLLLTNNLEGNRAWRYNHANHHSIRTSVRHLL